MDFKNYFTNSVLVELENLFPPNVSEEPCPSPLEYNPNENKECKGCEVTKELMKYFGHIVKDDGMLCIECSRLIVNQ